MYTFESESNVADDGSEPSHNHSANGNNAKSLWYKVPFANLKPVYASTQVPQEASFISVFCGERKWQMTHSSIQSYEEADFFSLAKKAYNADSQWL